MITFLGDLGQLRVVLDFCGFLKSRASHRSSTGKITPKQGLVIELQRVDWDQELASTLIAWDQALHLGWRGWVEGVIAKHHRRVAGLKYRSLFTGQSTGHHDRDK